MNFKRIINNGQDKILRRYIVAKHHQQGATMIEYALIIALVAIVAVAGFALFGGNFENIFNQINDALTGED